MSLGRPRQRSLNRAIQLLTQPPVVTRHFLARRPIRWRIRRQPAPNGINAERKQMVKGPLKRPQSERAIPQQIPVERLHVSDVKDNAMSLGYRPVIHGFFPDYPKELIGARARIEKTGVQVVPDADGCSESSHCVFPFSWMQHPWEGCAKIQRGEARCIRMFAPGIG